MGSPRGQRILLGAIALAAVAAALIADDWPGRLLCAGIAIAAAAALITTSARDPARSPKQAKASDSSAAAKDAFDRHQAPPPLPKLIARAAHEVRNPLNAIVMHVELLRRKTADVADAARHLDVLEEETRRVDRLLDGLMRLVRMEVGPLAPVALPDLVDDVLSVVATEAERRGVVVTLELPADLPPVLGDSEKLKEALCSLVRNALEAMPEGGNLRIGGRAGEHRPVELIVEDQGCGIPAEAMPEIFRLYYTTKPGSEGCGLSMAARIVALHGGGMAVESQPGNGARFTVSLPRAPAL